MNDELGLRLRAPDIVDDEGRPQLVDCSHRLSVPPGTEVIRCTIREPRHSLHAAYSADGVRRVWRSQDSVGAST